MVEVSVITPSVRSSGLALVQKALRRQTFQNYEWLVCSPEDYGYGTWIKDPGKNEGDYWSVYKSYNALVKASQGKLLVSWQDHTFTDPDTLQKFWDHYLEEPKTLVTAVGNKYSDETFVAQTWQDPRIRTDQGSFYRSFPNDVEFNLCALPREAVFAVGGYDERFDKYSSLCGLDVLIRLELLGGYDFKIDQGIKSYSTEHGRLPLWDEHTPFTGAWQKAIEEYKINRILTYL